jgi:uncharacterized protein (TIGR02118 family)
MFKQSQRLRPCRAWPATLTRREILGGAGAGVTVGMLASAFGALLPDGAVAARGAATGDCMTIVYPAGEGIRFDADYYRDHHLRTIMSLYGSSIARFELRTVMPAAAGAPPEPHAAAVNIWIGDLAAFDAGNARHGATLVADVPNFTNAMPMIQYDKIHGEMGRGRDSPRLGDACLTILYRNGEGVRWDVDYYRKAHMPLIMRLYGAAAISRFELRKGDSGQAPGTKPGFIGTVNIYINDQAAFDAAGKQHGPALIADVPHFSSVMPTAFPTVIHGIG